MNTSESNHIYFELNPDERPVIYRRPVNFQRSLEKVTIINLLRMIPKDELKSVLGLSIYAALQEKDYNNLLKFIKEQAQDNKHLMAATIGPVLTSKIINL